MVNNASASYYINPFMTEADRANQWTGFYIISASVMKGLKDYERSLQKFPLSSVLKFN